MRLIHNNAALEIKCREIVEVAYTERHSRCVFPGLQVDKNLV